MRDSAKYRDHVISNNVAGDVSINVKFRRVRIALDISMQRACALLSSVTCAALKYFSILSHKRHDFRKKDIQYKTRVFILSTTFCLTHFSF